MSDALLQLTRELLTDLGARITSVEPLTLALDGDLAEHFNTDSLTLAETAAVEDALVVAPGTPIFERVVSLLADHVQGTHLELEPTHPSPDTPPRSVGPADRFEDLTPEITEHLTHTLELAVRIAFISDGREEVLKLAHLVPDEDPEILEHSTVEFLLEDEDIQFKDEVAEVEDDAISALLTDAMAAARDWADDTSGDYEEPLLERLQEELRRLTTYYGELIAQAEDNEVLRKHLVADLDRRTAEEVGKHKLSVELTALAYALILRPRTRFAYALHPEHTQSWHFDRAEGTWRGPTCPVCNRSALRADLCEAPDQGDHTPHITCTRCVAPCDICGAVTCTDHGLVHGHIGDEALCALHAERCALCNKPTHPSRIGDDGVCETCA